MEKRKVFLAVPSHSGQPSDHTKATIGCIRMECGGLGWGLQEYILARDSIIAHARNVCVGQFLKSDCTEMLFLDDDVGAGPGVFTRLMMHRVDLVGGIYRAKMDEEKYMVRWLPEQKELWADPTTGLLEAQDVPFGFLRITRAAVEKMVQAYADEWFHAHYTEDGLKCWNLFNTEIRDHQFTGEDFFFCRRWREIGGRVWIDPELPLVHVGKDLEGLPVAFHGQFGDYLRGRAS